MKNEKDTKIKCLSTYNNVQEYHNAMQEVFEQYFENENLLSIVPNKEEADTILPVLLLSTIKEKNSATVLIIKVERYRRHGKERN